MHIKFKTITQNTINEIQWQAKAEEKKIRVKHIQFTFKARIQTELIK